MANQVGRGLGGEGGTSQNSNSYESYRKIREAKKEQSTSQENRRDWSKLKILIIRISL
jgi:hypothetical protein